MQNLSYADLFEYLDINLVEVSSLCTMHIFIVHYASVLFKQARKKEVEKSSGFRMG